MIFGGTAVQTLILTIITIRCNWENEVMFQWRLVVIFLLLLWNVQHWWSLSPLFSSLIWSALLMLAGRESKPACTEVVGSSKLNMELINSGRSSTSSKLFKMLVTRDLDGWVPKELLSSNMAVKISFPWLSWCSMCSKFKRITIMIYCYLKNNQKFEVLFLVKTKRTWLIRNDFRDGEVNIMSVAYSNSNSTISSKCTMNLP